MNRVFFGIVCVAAAALFASGCGTAKASTIPGMDVTTKLSRRDYVVLGTATGQACAEQSCFFGNCTTKASVAGEELLDGRAESSSLRAVRTAQLDLGPLNFLLAAPRAPSGGEIAKKIAMYKAIESIPDADAMLSPRYDVETSEKIIPLISRDLKSCVTVKGKAIRVKSDEEIKAAH